MYPRSCRNCNLQVAKLYPRSCKICNLEVIEIIVLLTGNRFLWRKEAQCFPECERRGIVLSSHYWWDAKKILINFRARKLYNLFLTYPEILPHHSNGVRFQMYWSLHQNERRKYQLFSAGFEPWTLVIATGTLTIILHY